jgi:excisionase family DNA binding protein
MADQNFPPFAADDDPWLPLSQVAEELNNHPATIRRWVQSGRLRATRVGRSWRVRRSELDRALRSGGSPAFTGPDASPALPSTLGPVHTPAPRQIADHIMTVAPRGEPKP